MNYLPHIIYINLDRRIDRETEIREQFKLMEIPEDKITRLSATEHNYPNAGCNFSHSRALRKAYELELEEVLILEDDFNFIEDKSLILNNLTKLYTIGPKDWTLIQLGLCQINAPDDQYDFIKKTTSNVSNACGYIVKREIMLKLAEVIENAGIMLEKTYEHWNYQNDVVWNQLNDGSWYHFTPPLGYQRKSYSDLSGMVVEFPR